MKERKILGVIGGMGPLTTASFFTRLVECTRADNDADHIHVIMDSDATIPDRTAAILQGDNGCIAAIRASAKRLVAAGAQVLAMPCNTAHAFFDDIASAAPGLPFLNMVDATVEAAAATQAKRIGVLATAGTVAAGVYQKKLEAAGLQAILPSPAGQDEVMGLIYKGVKAGAVYDVTALKAELDAMMERGTQLFILGCTELGVGFA
ncbi:MAG: amino acid racemase, partial [Christensenellaceae bacterium]|nr:amino acid racemase [Christensenellaceae bacterium]